MTSTFPTKPPGPGVYRKTPPAFPALQTPWLGDRLPFLTALFTGGVLALQTFKGFERFHAEAYVGSVVALSMLRELAPVLTGLMVAGRAGSAMAAELGNMRVTEQIDAIATMGVNPVQYLLSPRLVAAVTMVPLLCVLYTTVGMVGAYLIAVQVLGGDTGIFLQSVRDISVPKDIVMGIVKAGVFGFIVSAVSCRHGFFATGGARGVGLATTRAVVESCVAILIANYLLTQALLDVDL